MPELRSETLERILDDIDRFSFTLNEYFDDAEPMGVIDSLLTGKINSLIAFFQILGWQVLYTQIENMTPVRCNAVEILDKLKNVIIPEARRQIQLLNLEDIRNEDHYFWQNIHPKIVEIAKPRFDAGFYADSVESSFKEINDIMKNIVTRNGGREMDGASLMNTALSLNNPIIKLTPLISETDKNIQQGYMQIFAGSMVGIRNPKAHGNLNPDKKRTLHLLSLASLLMYKIDERL
jgi:uncharacterized protein (TIGR02391 family)